MTRPSSSFREARLADCSDARPGLPDGCSLQPWCLKTEGVKHVTAAGGLVEKAEMNGRVYVRSVNEAFKITMRQRRMVSGLPNYCSAADQHTAGLEMS